MKKTIIEHKDGVMEFEMSEKEKAKHFDALSKSWFNEDNVNWLNGYMSALFGVYK